MTIGEALNHFAKAAHAPQLALRVDENLTKAVPAPVRSGIMALPTVKQIRNQVYGDLGIPPEAMEVRDFRCTFDARDTQRALDGTGIAVPPLDTYAGKLWDYWERNLDPALFRDRSLATAIKDKRVLITGASSGIGLETALRIGEAGGTVILVARTREKLEEVAKQVEAKGGTAHVHPADLSDLEDIERMAQEVIDAHGGVDVLINNAGRSIRRSVARSYDRFHDFERTMQLNYFGALKLILALLPGMRERKTGHIINVSSIGVQTNTPRFSAYVASKSALDAFSRCVAPECVADNVKFTTIYMPLVRTPMIAPTDMYKAFPTMSPEEAGADALRRDDRQAQAQGVEARHVRRGALRAVAGDRGHRPQPGLQPLPRLQGGEGEEGQGAASGRGAAGRRRGDVDRGGRDGVPAEGRPLLALSRAARPSGRSANDSPTALRIEGVVTPSGSPSMS